MDNMKCIKNKKTGNIVRVTDVQAHQMVGSQWEYVSKSEWKSKDKPKPATNETTN